MQFSHAWMFEQYMGYFKMIQSRYWLLVLLSFSLIGFFLIAASSYPEERLRYWNGYLLFYEKMEEVRTPMSAKKSRVSSKVLKSAEKTE